MSMREPRCGKEELSIPSFRHLVHCQTLTKARIMTPSSAVLRLDETEGFVSYSTRVLGSDDLAVDGS